MDSRSDFVSKQTINEEEVVMEILRREPAPGIYAEMSFVRVGNGALVDSPDDSGLIELFRECAEGKRCISELDSDNLIVVKVDVPARVLKSRKHSYGVIEWLFYSWKPRDMYHVGDPDKHRPFEAVSLEAAGIDTDYLVSIADDFHVGGGVGMDGGFGV